jgi:ribose transport system permease protein
MNPTETGSVEKPFEQSTPRANGGSRGKLVAALGPLGGLVLVLGLFTFINGLGFLSLFNIQTMLADFVVVAIAALGMTVIIIGGGIDLSTGSLAALASVASAMVLQKLDPSSAGQMTPAMWVMAFAAGIGAAMCCGFLSGMAVVGLRVVPFIATLGMLSVARGAAKWLSDNQPINVTDAFSGWVQPQVQPAWLILPLSVWLVLVLAIVIAFVLARTVYGRHVTALGGSEATSRLCGLNIGWLKLSLYMLGGAMAGLAGVLLTARLTRGDPSVAVGLELNVIASVVIGGGSLRGGEGSVAGTLAGALIMSALAAGATQALWPNYVQEILVGLIIVVAVALDQWRARRALRA